MAVIVLACRRRMYDADAGQQRGHDDDVRAIWDLPIHRQAVQK